MSRRASPGPRPVGVKIHSDFLPYIAVKEQGMRSFLIAIAVNAVGQAITLAAIGVKLKALTMPDCSMKARCRLTLPTGAMVSRLNLTPQGNPSPARLLEATCCQISGAVAEFALDESEHYGNLGLEDIEESYGALAAYASRFNVPEHQVLAGCCVVVERLLDQHWRMAVKMAAQLFRQGHLCEAEMKRYLSRVRKEALGEQVLAAFQEPWIADEVDRVQRMFIGSG